MPRRPKAVRKHITTEATNLPRELLEPPDALPPPPVEPRVGVLPFHELSWPNFERLLVAIARDVLLLHDARRYGVDGQAQHGLDVIAYTTEGAPRAIQGKDVAKFNKGLLKRAIDKFAKGRRPFECRWLAIAVACSVERAEVLEELHRLQQHHSDLTLNLWGEQELSEMLRDHPDLVIRFFGTEWGRIFCTPSPVVAATDVAQRNQHLRTLLTASRARLITRWLAAGLDETKAEEFSDNANLGVPTPLAASVPATGLCCLEGEFGTGKSIFGERLHQRDVSQALGDTNAPIPVHLTARLLRQSLKEAILAEAKLFGDPHLIGARVVLNGIDEAGLIAANELLEQARILVRSWPQTRIIITARPGIASRQEERLTMPLLTEKESQSLLAQIIGMANVEFNWPPSVREAICRPLFLLIAASVHRDSHQHLLPQSPAFFLEALVKRALGRTGHMRTETRTILMRLAILTLASGGTVSTSDFGTEDDQEGLLSTRLIIKRSRTLAFALPIIEQYFGAQALLEGLIDLEPILKSPESIEPWRYSLALSTALGNWTKISEILGQLTTHQPGLAIWIVKEAIPAQPNKEAREVSLLPDNIECARRLHQALTAWLLGLEPISRLTGLARSNGTSHTVAARHKDGRLTAGLQCAEDDSTEANAIELPEKAHPFSAGNTSQRWEMLRSAYVPSTEAGWPWRWSLQWLEAGVARLLEQKALPVQRNSPAREEQRWAVANWLLGRRDRIFHTPLPALQLISAAEQLLEGLKEEDNQMAFYPLGIYISASELRQVASELASGSDIYQDGLLHRPWVAPDRRDSGGNKIWDLYTDETLRILVEQVYQAALSIYDELVTSWFPKLRPSLRWAAVLPFRLEGMMKRRRNARASTAPTLDYFIQPLQTTSSAVAAITFADTEEIVARYREVVMPKQEERAYTERLRWHPASLQGIRLSARNSWTGTTLRVYGTAPATNLAYRWLWRDLHELRLLSQSSLSYGDDL